MGFYGLEIAKTGLMVSQAAIDLVGHNITNAATKGYTRQRIITQSIDAPLLNMRFERVDRASIGGGVEMQAVTQVRSNFIDRELRREYAKLGQWTVHADTLEYIESLLDPSATGSISNAIAGFYNSLSKLSTDPASLELRTNVQQSAITLTSTMNHYYAQLAQLQNEQNEKMYTTVQQINSLLSNIASYNDQIFTYELSGEHANDLRDKRNLLLDELASLVNIEYAESSDGKLSVKVDGVTLVDHVTATLLEAVPDQNAVVTGSTGYYSIYYQGTTDEFQYSGGELAAYRALRDGNSVLETGIPRIISGLNELSRALAEEFNNIHATGHTLPIGSNPSLTGVNFFDVPAGGYAQVTAGNFALSAEILADVANIAASSLPVDLTAPDSQQGNNLNLLEMVELCSSVSVPGVGNFEDYLKTIISEVAIEGAASIGMVESQTYIVQNLENRRESISGVSIDEEMVQLIKFEHAYSAASRLITAIDEALDTLINKTGVVGR